MKKLLSLAVLLMLAVCIRCGLDLSDISALKIPPCQPPAEEGTKYTILTGTDTIVDASTVQWYIRLNGRDVDISKGTTVNDPFVADFSLLRPPNSGLVINSVNRTLETTFTCQVSNNVHFQCNLQVYKQPENVKCEDLNLLPDGSWNTTCTTSLIYPYGQCIVIVGDSLRENATIEIQNAVVSKDPVYYSTTCDIHFDVKGMTRGNYTVHMYMYPDLPGLGKDVGSALTILQDMELSIPTLSGLICENVADGYFLEGQSTCTCQALEGGYPPGRLQWSRSDGGSATTGFEELPSDRILLFAEGSYTCEGLSDLIGPYDRKTVSVKHRAYGPTAVDMYFVDYDDTSVDAKVKVACVVNQTDVRPEPTFDLEVSSKSAVRTISSSAETRTDGYAKVFVIQPLQEGSHTLTCVVTNSKFRQLSARNSVTLITTVNNYESSSSTSDVAIGVGLGVGAVVLIIIVLAIVFCVARRRGCNLFPASKDRSNKEQEQQGQQMDEQPQKQQQQQQPQQQQQQQPQDGPFQHQQGSTHVYNKVKDEGLDHRSSDRHRYVDLVDDDYIHPIDSTYKNSARPHSPPAPVPHHPNTGDGTVYENESTRRRPPPAPLTPQLSDPVYEVLDEMPYEIPVDQGLQDAEKAVSYVNTSTS